METLLTRINETCPLSETENTFLRRTLRTLHFPKGSAVVGEGKIDDSIYFIRRGVWRASIDRNGEDQTLWFAVPGEMVFSSWGYIKGLPSRYNIFSSSDSVAVELKKSAVEKLTESSPAFQSWLLERCVEILISTDDALIDMWNPKAKNRYLAFMKQMPEIFQHVPLKEIAGYIGVTPQSLSRIRASLYKDENQGSR